MKKYIISILIAFISIFIYSEIVQVSASSLEFSNEIPENFSSSLNINEVSDFTNIVIFIRFQDEETYVAPHGFLYYENLFNGINDISLRDYFLEVSYGQMDINSVFATTNQEILYYVDTEDRSYYQEYDEVSNPNGVTEENSKQREHELLKRAVDYVEYNNLVDDSLDLDVNDDGEIDCISFLVSGEDQGWNTLLWPHKWSLTSYYNYSLGEFKSDAPTINGLNAYTYTFELLGDNPGYKYAVDVAVLAHETFHLISSPDLYHYYDYDWVSPIGYWGLMESLGTVPNHMLGYMKETYGNWIQDVDEITQSGTYTLFPLQESGENLYQINTGYSNEYIYLEYRDNVGQYESELPSSGLLVYRVDKDYYDNGNIYGYYDSEGEPQDEVFIFRPGIVDTIEPITFENFDDESIDEDGDIDSAALSNLNLYDEMGNNTSILTFHSDGSLMDIKIYNVVEHDGYITFDVYIPPVITLQSDFALEDIQNLYLVDAIGLNYYVDLSNTPVNGTVYYTVDGSTPDLTSMLYQGNPIEITAQNNNIQIALYLDDELMSIVSKSYQFASSIESDHSPYGNEVELNWYINLNQATEYDLIFDSLFELENDYDFITFFDGTTTSEYTGTELQDQTLSFNNTGLLINFTSDYAEDDFMVFFASILVHNPYTFELNGDSNVSVEVFDTYSDLGYSLSGTLIDGYYVQSSTQLDLNSVGNYSIQYFLFDATNTLIDTITRTVHVIDTIIPEIVLEGEATVYVELGENYTEQGSTFFDNYDATGEVVIAGDVVNTSVIGSYIITYNTSDQSGNDAIEVIRTVIIQDTTAPLISLNPSLDTLEVGSVYQDYSVTVIDLSYTQITVMGLVDTGTPGTYRLTYLVEDAFANSSSIVRVVTVYDPTPTVEFTLGNAATTIPTETNYIDGICKVTVNSIEYDCVTKESNLNTSIAGVYYIIYSYTLQEEEYTYKRYIIVVDGSTDIVMPYLASKEEGGIQ